MVAHVWHQAELAAALLALLTILTSVYVVRDRRYSVMKGLYEVEREHNRVLVQELQESRARVAALASRPNLDQHAALLDRLTQTLENHEREAAHRLEQHEQRAQQRTDAVVGVLHEMTAFLRNGGGHP